MNKWTIIFLSATTASIIGCGWGWNGKNTVKNKAPFFNNGTPSAISMEENTTRHNIFAICTDPESWVIKYNIDYMSTYFTKNILKDTMLYGKKFTLHDTRHLFVTVMYIQGYESWTLDRCISHTNTGVKGIYIQNSEERRFEILKNIGIS